MKDEKCEGLLKPVENEKELDAILDKEDIDWMEKESSYNYVKYAENEYHIQLVTLTGLMTLINEIEPDDSLSEERAEIFRKFFKIVESFNKSFVKLLEINEPVPALALIRIQLDNLKILYAEKLYPNVILRKVYGNGLELSQIKVKGKQISPTDIMEKLNERFAGIKKLWGIFSGYIHPNKKQIEIQTKTELRKGFKPREEPYISSFGNQYFFTSDDFVMSEKDREELSGAMKAVNIAILLTLDSMISELEERAAKLEIHKSEVDFLQMEIARLTNGTGWH